MGSAVRQIALRGGVARENQRVLHREAAVEDAVSVARTGLEIQVGGVREGRESSHPARLVATDGRWDD